MSIEYNRLTTLQKNNLKAKAIETNITGAISIVHQYEYFSDLQTSGQLKEWPHWLDDNTVKANATLLKMSDPLIIESAEKVNHNLHARVKRVKDYLFKMLSLHKCIWVTLTFNDNALKKYKPQVLKKYACQFLKSYSPYYMANVDYGPLHDRVHYHAIIMANSIPQGSWPYGFAWFDTIGTSKKDMQKISTYIAKLTNHSFKDSTKNTRMIFSKDMKKVSNDYWLKNKIKNLKSLISEFEKNTASETDDLPF